MAVIEQDYDIDLKSTGAFPVVKCSQFDTGSREIVFTVYDNWELANIDGCLARVDGTRNDGVEFSVSCTVSTGSKVSFTITQEMTKTAGKHPAELVIFDAQGNPIGTQNFLIEVEAAPMVRDAAASADDRTLYDQFTQSIEDRFNSLSESVTGTLEDISALIGASSKPITIYDEDVKVLGEFTVRVRLTYDPVTALVHAVANGEMTITTGNSDEYDLCQIDSKYCPDEDFFTDVADSDPSYIISTDNLKEIISGDAAKNSNFQEYYIKEHDGAYKLRFWLGAGAPDHEGYYKVSLNAVWYARGGKYMGVTPIPTGSNTVTVGTTTTGAPGTQASVVNSGTAKDVVLDFTIPSGAGGAGGGDGVTIAGAPKAKGTVEYYSVHEAK